MPQYKHGLKQVNYGLPLPSNTALAFAGKLYNLC